MPADAPEPGHALAERDAIATAFSRGSESAFEDVYRRHAHGIHDFLRWTVRDESVAEDLTQATFLRAWERRESLRDPAALRGWLYRIAHNLAMNEVTRRHPAEQLDEETPIASGAAGPEALAAQGEIAELVWDAAASLEPRQYAVLDMSLRKGLTNSEVGDVLGLDGAATSLAVHRAREALGNGVRYLLVARRRHHCERLAELVPEGVRRLTPAQRATVDRHMRRCAICQRTATMLTAPELLFGAAPLSALPAGLARAPRLPAASGPGQGLVGQGARVGPIARSTWGSRAAVVGAVVVATVLIAVVVRAGPSASPLTLATSGRSPSAAAVSVATPSPIPSLAASPSPEISSPPPCATGAPEPAVTASGVLEVCPSFARAGETLSVHSVTPCAKPAPLTHAGVTTFGIQAYLEVPALGSGPSASPLIVPGTLSGPDPHGNWSSAITLPATLPSGPYVVTAACLRLSSDASDPNSSGFAYAPVTVHIQP